MGFFGNLFGKRQQEPTLSPEQADIVAKALWVLLRSQINALGHELWAVPTANEFVTEKCRGYLFGLSAGVLHAHDLLTVGGHSGRDALDATFQVVYGPAGRQLAIASLRDTQRPAFRAASEFAIEEVSQVYAMNHCSTATGFYLYKIGQL